MVSDLAILNEKLNFKFELIEKPHFYTDGKLIRSAPFPKSEKVMLKEITGESMMDIIVDLNKEYRDKGTLVVYIDRNGVIATESKTGKVKIQCLTM